MPTSDVTVTIGVNNVSNYVKDVDINKNKNTGIGSCELVLNNDGDVWGGTFISNNAVNVSINGVLMFVGFVDDVIPYMDKRGVLTNELTVKCRDHGRYLTDYHNTAKYEYQESGAIIDKILAAVGDPLLYTDPTGTPSTKYECQRTYLSDSIIDIAQIVGWDFYIDTNGRLQYFLTGSVDSGVDLLSVAGAPTNNLLSFEEYENIGTDIKNIVEIHAGSTKDHWTEGGSADWTTLIGAGSAITDETTVFIYGVSSIKFVAVDIEEVVGLDFTTGVAPDYLYSQGGIIDMSSFCQATVAFIPEALSAGSYNFNPTLIDSGGNVIYFTRNREGQSSKGFTQQINASAFTWHVLSFPIGEHTGNQIYASAYRKSGYWYYDDATRTTVSQGGAYTSAAIVDDGGSGRGTITADGGVPFSIFSAGDAIELQNCEDGENDGVYYVYSATNTVITLTSKLPTSNGADTSIDILTSFSWNKVTKIGFRLVSSNIGTMDTVYIDALYIPNIEAKSIARNAASIAAYGTRMISEYRKELHSQIELDSASAKRLRYYKDPVQKFKAVAIGQTGTKYASQVVDVQAPSYGIAGLTDYIIASLHHKLHYNVDVRGWDYITEYDLVASDTDASRIIYTDNPMEKWLQELRKQNRGFKGAQTDDESYYGDWMTGITPQINTGATFPTDANNGDLFFLTADYNDGNQYYGPALYKYVEATTTWLRDPMVMYRAAAPPAGGEMTGDYYYNTATDIMYQWTGGAWVALDFSATVISGTLSSSQLKKGIQRFDSSVFFYPIRAAASNTVTFAIDVDNGAGKAVITASAGTPFSTFTAGDELIIQGCEDPLNDSIVKIIDSVGGGGLSITLTNTLAGGDTATDETCVVSVRDGVRWVGANPAVWFADGTNQQVVSGDVNGLALGSHWIYFSTADTDAHTTAVYADAVGDTVGIICRLEVTSDAEPLIMPVYSRGGNMTLDFLGAGAVDTIVLTADAIIGKDLRTSAGVNWTDGVGDPGVILERRGIKGKGAAGALQTLMQSTDGKIIAGAGVVTLASNGITIKGQGMYFTDAADALRGWVWGLNPGNPYLQVAANGGDLLLTSGVGKYIELLVAGNSVRFNPAGDIVFADSFDAIIPTNTGNLDVGTSAKEIGNVYADNGYFSTRLRIPVGVDMFG